MRVQRSTPQATLRDRATIVIGPEVSPRMAVQPTPDAEIVECFVFTDGAQRAWAAVNQYLSGNHGGFLWITGAAGTGKTHFLNYIIALSNRAGLLPTDTGRHLVLPIAIANLSDVPALDRLTVDAITEGLSGEKRGDIWRTMGGIEALRLVLDSARRQGVRTVTLLVDFDAFGCEPAISYLKSVADMARSIKNPKLIVVAASRNGDPDDTTAVSIAPGSDEVMTVAMGRARRIDDAALSMVEHAYGGIDLGNTDARAIFPLHPTAIAALRALDDSSEAVPGLAKLVRELLLSWVESADRRRILYPFAVMQTGAVTGAVEEKLGDVGRAALRAAYAAAEKAEDGHRSLARQIVDTLVLNQMAGGKPTLTIEDLRLLVPPVATGVRVSAAAQARILEALARSSNGTIVFDPATRTAGFDPQSAAAPEVARFNSALQLICCFDSTITAARQSSDLNSKLKRLGDAMASALEGAHRSRDLFTAAVVEMGGRISAEQEKAFADFVALAENGPMVLLDTGADPNRREAALGVLAAYKALAQVAAAVPRLRSMREYLDDTQLHASLDQDPAKDRSLAELETTCAVLRTGVTPAAVTNASRSLDSLEARFQQFKWTYVQYYRAAHRAWRNETDRLGAVVEETRLLLDALQRLNSISALGSAQGTGLFLQMASLARRVVRCDLEGPLSPEITPRCPRCGFVIGTPSPREELSDLATLARRALNDRLAILSQSAIAQLIEQHDRSHRLEGFLKITQAAQTDALVRVLDDKLARYLGRLLDEHNVEDLEAESGGRNVVRSFRTRGGHSRGQSRIKLPPSGDRR